MTSRKEFWKHVAMLAAIAILVGLAYAKVTTTYFCAYDDFINLHQTVFRDAYQPSSIFTTSHFDSYKYRPLSRAINLSTYYLGDSNATVFRVRNTAFHVFDIILVYSLGWLLFRSLSVSGVAALLFGLHPLANQSIIGAIWTNTIAHTGLLLALVMFIVSVQSKGYWAIWLVVALLSAWSSLLAYDSQIVVFGMMLIYLFGAFSVGKGPSKSLAYCALFSILSAILLGIYFWLRLLFVTRGLEQAARDVPSVGIAITNLSMYLLALLSPLDPILANEWLGVRLPSEIGIDGPTLRMFGGIAAVIVIVFGYFLFTRSRGSLSKSNWPIIAFLISGVILPLLPVLIFSSHPSETYLYLPLAFWSLLLSYSIQCCLPSVLKVGAPWWGSILLLVFGLFFSATWVRNQRVTQCGETVYRILDSLPGKLLVKGAWTVTFANVPGEITTRRYGFYGFHGIDTIGQGSYADLAVTSALQLKYQNMSLIGKVVKANDLSAMCGVNPGSRNLCVLVHWDGSTEMCCVGSVPTHYLGGRNISLRVTPNFKVG